MRRKVTKQGRSKLKLDDLVAGITPENRHEAIDWGPPVGREFTGDAWEECQPGTNPVAGFDSPSTPR